MNAADGRPVASEVTWAVDYGVLSLTAYKAPNVLPAIYSPRPLQVSAADSRLGLSTQQQVTSMVSHVQRSSTVMGLPLSGLAMTLDGVNAQEQFLKDSSGSSFFSMVRPMTDLMEEVTASAATPGADRSESPGVRADFRAMAFGSDQSAPPQMAPPAPL